ALPLIACSLLLGSSIVLLVYGAEEWATGGRLSQAVVVAAANLGRVHPADRAHVVIVAVAVLGRTIGLIALWAAAAAAAVQARPGLGRRALAAAGAGLVILLVGLLFAQGVIGVMRTLRAPDAHL